MAKFFRRIRQQLLSESKLTKYLLYAAGEIILVVIGILIALGINNKNQRSVTRAKEQTYLIGLHEEFSISKNKLEQLIKVNQDNYNGAKALLNFMSTSDSVPSERLFSSLLFDTFSSDVAFNPNNSLLQEMINSGSLKDISNTVLRIQLTNWISTIDDVSKQEQELGIQREKVLDMFRTEHTSLRTIYDETGITNHLGIHPNQKSYSNLHLLTSRVFENNVLMFILTARSMKEAHYKPLFRDLEEILQLIEGEIE